MSRLPRDLDSAEARRERLFRALRPFAHDPGDPVERWKRTALGRVVDGSGAAVEPRVQLGVGLGFTLTGLLAGLAFGRGGPLLALVGLALVVLTEEVPRALLQRSWGRSSSIVLGSGGAVTETFGRKLERWQVIASELVGPLANIAFGALCFALSRRLPAPAAGYAQTLALWQGAWGALQALPLVPFRAGNALAARARAPYPAVLTAFSLKFLLLGGLVLSKLSPVAFPLVMLAVAGGLRDFSSIYRVSVNEKQGLSGEARLAEVLVGAGERMRALAVARRALARARSHSLRVRLWRSFAWAALGEGDPLLAHGALGALPSRELDLHLVGSYLATCNRADEAVALLEQARTLGQRSPETTKLLLELLLRRGDVARGRSVAREDASLLSADDRRALAASELGVPSLA